ncbi:type I restriction-modification system subunit M [Thermophilibacter mediterraneus]|uniref:type I restriction-modification system subunit M n=1 Tax=Thermophilibacter mediterraneus TaxID=1871031 RepID=UPI002357F187|nr:class I SAM-dependent DNA methyltransferase [Thermophilibacter mediterraneus]
MTETPWNEGSEDITYEANRIWANANVLRGTYLPDKYGDVIIPMTVLRRLECTLESTKEKVLAAYEADPNRAPRALCRDAGLQFYCTSRFTLAELVNDADNLAANFFAYLDGFSSNVQGIFSGLSLRDHIKRMAEHNCLLPIVQNFATMDLHPSRFDSSRMGGIFENLIGRFYSNVDAGQYYTPRDIVRTMVALGLAEGAEDTYDAGKVITVYDGAAGTAGMLTAAEGYIRHYNPAAIVKCYGQELMPQTYAVGMAEMLIRDQDSTNYRQANTLMEDCWPNMSVRFVFMNPPFGTEWGGKGASDPNQEKYVTGEDADHSQQHRWPAGLPKKNDSQLLFLQAAVNKLTDDGRAVIVENGSPLFNGDAGSGESEVRRWLLEEDLLEAIIALSPSSFVNTGIAVYLWVISKNKRAERRGKVQLIDATEIRHSMRKNQGEKRYELTREDREEIVRLYSELDDSDPRVQIYDYREFEYREYTVVQPMRRNYAITEERIETMLAGRALSGVWDEEAIAKLQEKDELKPSEQKRLAKLMAGRPAYDAIVAALRGAVSDEVFVDPKVFGDHLREVLKNCDATTALRNKIVDALSERDESAPIQKDRCGNVVYDKDTRDTERVPLLVDVDEYMEREVYPYVSDAHVTFDENLAAKKPVIKTGAEIPFTRYFYKYQEPENPEDVLAEVLEFDARAQSGLTALVDGE